MKELEAHAAGRGFQRLVEQHPERLIIAETSHHFYVAHCDPGLEILAISCRKGAAELTQTLVAAALAERLDQRLLEIVLPVPPGRGELGLDRSHVVIGNLSR